MKKIKLITVIISAVLTLTTIMPITASAKSQYNEIISMKNVSYRLNNSTTLYEIGNIEALVYIDDNGRISSTGDVSLLHDIDESKLDNLYYIDKNGKKITVNDVNEIMYTNEKGYKYFTGGGPNNKSSNVTSSDSKSNGLFETISNAFWKYDVNGKWHWINNNVETIGWKSIVDKTYYFDPNGEMHIGWLELDGKKYYFDELNGEMKKSTKLEIDGKVYSFDSNGSLKENAVPQKTGWIKDKDVPGGANWRYVDSNLKNHIGWLSDGDYWYYFDKCGYMVRNHIRRIDGNIYSFDNNGHMERSLSRTNIYTEKPINHTGPTDGSGLLCASFNYKISIDSNGVCTLTNDYYNKIGVSVNNVLLGKFGYDTDDGGYSMLFDKNGDQVFGWYLEPIYNWNADSKDFSTVERWTYYDENGLEVRNTSKVIDGKSYSFDKDGYLI